MADMECLKQLRRVVEAAPEDRFRMRTYWAPVPCGTAYCAAGWAAIDPWFRENTSINRWLRPEFAGMLSYHGDVERGLREVFGLGRRNARHLFGISIDTYATLDGVTRQHVLANVDRLLAGKATRSYGDMLAES